MDTPASWCALVFVMLFGCQERRAAPPPPPTPSVPGPTAEVVPWVDASAPSAPVPTGGPVDAKGRSTRAAQVVAACTSPPPTACAVDRDCAIFDIPTNDNPCASTLRVGIRADQKDAYLARSPCPGASHANSPPCVVHWVRAEEADQPPAKTVIAAQCVKTANAAQGVCRTRYVAQ